MVKKKLALLSITLTVSIIIMGFSVVGFDGQSLACLACDGDGGVVDKAPCEAFTVKIVFKTLEKTKAHGLLT